MIYETVKKSSANSAAVMYGYALIVELNTEGEYDPYPGGTA
jgi:hypothetical protein